MEIALITGASSGIGQSAAVHLAKRGAGVIVTYHGNKQGGLETVATIEREGGRAVALPLDVSRSETFAEFKDTVARVMRMHLKGPYFLTPALLPLLADGGAIVNTVPLPKPGLTVGGAATRACRPASSRAIPRWAASVSPTTSAR